MSRLVHASVLFVQNIPITDKIKKSLLIKVKFGEYSKIVSGIKNRPILEIYLNIFWRFEKSQYLCSPFKKKRLVL